MGGNSMSSSSHACLGYLDSKGDPNFDLGTPDMLYIVYIHFAFVILTLPIDSKTLIWCHTVFPAWQAQTCMDLGISGVKFTHLMYRMMPDHPQAAPCQFEVPSPPHQCGAFFIFCSKQVPIIAQQAVKLKSTILAHQENPTHTSTFQQALERFNHN